MRKEKKEGLKKIMIRAWEIKREDKKNVFALCLKMAWAEAKVSERIAIKGWFQRKMEEENNAYIYNWENTIVRETEKAILLPVTFQTRYGREFRKNCWIPKSCLGKEEKKGLVVLKIA